MPTQQEAAMAVAGRVDSVSERLNRDGSVRGIAYWITTGDGAIQTTLKLQDAHRVGAVVGDQVCWLVRPSTFTLSDGPEAGSLRYFTAFVREANAGDIDRLLSALKTEAK